MLALSYMNIFDCQACTLQIEKLLCMYPLGFLMWVQLTYLMALQVLIQQATAAKPPFSSNRETSLWSKLFWEMVVVVLDQPDVLIQPTFPFPPQFP